MSTIFRQFYLYNRQYFCHCLTLNCQLWWFVRTFVCVCERDTNSFKSKHISDQVDWSKSAGFLWIKKWNSLEMERKHTLFVSFVWNSYQFDKISNRTTLNVCVCFFSLSLSALSVSDIYIWEFLIAPSKGDYGRLNSMEIENTETHMPWTLKCVFDTVFEKTRVSVAMISVTLGS